MSTTFTMMRILITIIVVSGLTVLIRKGGRETVDEDKEDNNITLQLPKIFFWIGVIATGVFIAILIICIVVSSEIYALTVLILFILLSYYLSVAAIVWKIEFSRKEDFFYYTSSFGRKHKIYYIDITYFYSSGDTLIFKVKKKTFMVYSYINNYKKFLKNLEVRIDKKMPKSNSKKDGAMKRALKQVKDAIGFIIATCIMSGCGFFLAGFFIVGLCTHSFPDDQVIGLIIFVLIALIVAVGYPFIFAFAVNNRKKYPRLARAMVKRGYFIDD